MNNCLVTGGAGFIGSHIIDRLIEEGNRVAVIDDLSSGKKENLNPQAVFYDMDIRDPGIKDIFEKERPEVVFHLAAQVNVRDSVADPIKDAQTNILGSLNIIKNFFAVNQKKLNDPKVKFIFSSTGGAIYGDAQVIPTPETYREFPLSPYGIAKLAVEKYLNYYYKNFNMHYAALRYANVYGPRQNSKGEAGVVAIFCGKMLAGIQPEITGDGSQTRDFVYVQDVVEANVLAMGKSESDFYNIGTGIETDINAIFDLINVNSGENFPKKYGSALAGEQKRSCLDCSKARRELRWQPKTSLNEGIAKTAEWFVSKV
jgi:UDP-glucose 4-epimerase